MPATKRRKRQAYVSHAQARTIREVKRHIAYLHPGCKDVIARRVDPMDAKRGFIAGWN